jgi:AcrR family transcriptional regulator
MTSAETIPDVRSQRPKRADARRNYDKLIAAARDAFTEEGGSASLEEVARRAGVGIGTLYRNFPTRQDLLEAVYVEEVEAVCRTAEDLMDDPPWEALVAWLHRFLDYVATKQALSQELFNHLGRDADVFRGCRTAFYAAGDRLLVRAQDSGDVRTDVSIDDVVMLVAGISKMPATGEGQIPRILNIALEGLRRQAQSGGSTAP